MLEFATQRIIDAEELINNSKNFDKNYFVKSLMDNATFSVMHKKLFCEFCKRKGYRSKYCRMKTAKGYKRGENGHYEMDCRSSKISVKNLDEKHLAYDTSFIVETIRNSLLTLVLFLICVRKKNGTIR